MSTSPPHTHTVFLLVCLLWMFVDFQAFGLACKVYVTHKKKFVTSNSLVMLCTSIWISITRSANICTSLTKCATVVRHILPVRCAYIHQRPKLRIFQRIVGMKCDFPKEKKKQCFLQLLRLNCGVRNPCRRVRPRKPCFDLEINDMNTVMSNCSPLPSLLCSYIEVV